MADISADSIDRFVPRTINPIKVGRVVIFSAEKRIRESAGILTENMPWIDVDVVHDPQSVNGYIANVPLVFILDDTALPLVDADAVRSNNPGCVIVLVTANMFLQSSAPQPSRERFPFSARADLTFAYDAETCAPPLIVPASVRAAEDLINIRQPGRVRRFVVLVVDDEPRWVSQFLPVLYNIIGQRAAVMIARTFEETLTFLFGTYEDALIADSVSETTGQGDDVVFLITDLIFPRCEELDSNTGRDLIRLISRHYPRIPIVIASKADEADNFRDDFYILPKGDPGSLKELKDHIHDYSGIGDFIVINEHGRVLYRITNIRELHEVLCHAEEESPEGVELREIFKNYGQRDAFSTWLYMHSYRELGDTIRPDRSQGLRLITFLKEHVEKEIERLDTTPLIIGPDQVFTLNELVETLKSVPRDVIQHLADNDVISSWLDWKGYSLLADEVRPIHGSGEDLREVLTLVIERWIREYRE
ncbi:hypothetical protein ACFL6R_05860 [Gemmatimonadota bacterium]